MGPATRALEASSLAAAALLLAAACARLAASGALVRWWLWLALPAGAISADLASGLVHWLAHTWGSDSLPVLGHRLLRPFRVHHVNPEDFLRRDFIDCNGDVALMSRAPLLAALFAPVPLAAFLTAFAAVSLPTNQVHQWAHQPEPPRAVAWLQWRGVILSRAEHARHHRAPHVTHYCIATGWCKRALAASGLFARLERAITALTGVEPRSDERAFAAHAAGPT